MDRPAMELQEGFIDRSIDSNDSQNSGLALVLRVGMILI